MDTFFIFCAKYLFVLPIIVLIVYVFIKPWAAKKRAVYFAAPSLALAYILAKVAGMLYYDPRPFVVDNFTPLVAHAADNGFPSDHTLLVATLAAIGTYLNWRLGVVLWIIALLVAV